MGQQMRRPEPRWMLTVRIPQSERDLLCAAALSEGISIPQYVRKHAVLAALRWHATGQPTQTLGEAQESLLEAPGAPGGLSGSKYGYASDAIRRGLTDDGG